MFQGTKRRQVVAHRQARKELDDGLEKKERNCEEPGGLHGLADLVGPIVATYKWFQMVTDQGLIVSVWFSMFQ